MIRARATIAAIVAIVAATAGFAAPSASAATRTLHLFAKEQAFGLYQADGTELSVTAPSERGDYVIQTNIVYMGDHNKHAAKPAGASNTVCTFTTATDATCDEVIAIGGSLLLFNHIAVVFSSRAPVTRITGGTGRFKGAHGTVTATPLFPTLNNDYTIKYSN